MKDVGAFNTMWRRLDQVAKTWPPSMNNVDREPVYPMMAFVHLCEIGQALKAMEASQVEAVLRTPSDEIRNAVDGRLGNFSPGT